MFVGDAEEEELYDITNHFGAELDSDVYKVGHHGSHNSSSESFLRYVTPAYIINHGDNELFSIFSSHQHDNRTCFYTIVF